MTKAPDLAPWRNTHLLVIGELMHQYERCRCGSCRVALTEALETYDEAKW